MGVFIQPAFYCDGVPQTESSLEVPAAEEDKSHRLLSVSRASHVAQTREVSMWKCFVFRKPFVCSENRA